MNRAKWWFSAVVSCVAAVVFEGTCGTDGTDGNVGMAVDRPQECTLASAPSLSLGAEGDSLWFSDIVDIEWVTDSTIIVAEPATLRLLASGTGRIIAELGGRGEGPGEFRVVDALAVDEAGTGVWVHDRRNRRISHVLFDGSVSSMRELVADGPISYPSVEHILSDGHVVVSGETSTTSLSVSSDGIVRSVRALAVFSEELKFSRMIWETAAATDRFRAQGLSGSGRIIEVPLVFGQRSYTETNGDILVVANSDSAMFRKLPLSSSGKGTPVAWERIDRPIADMERERRIQILSGPSGASRRDFARRLMRQGPQRQQVPQIGGLAIGPNGTIWVAGFEYLLELPTPWLVFSNGELVGRLRTPAGFRVQSVRDSLVAGIWKDQFGTEHVQIYALECERNRDS